VGPIPSRVLGLLGGSRRVRALVKHEAKTQPSDGTTSTIDAVTIEIGRDRLDCAGWDDQLLGMQSEVWRHGHEAEITSSVDHAHHRVVLNRG